MADVTTRVRRILHEEYLGAHPEHQERRRRQTEVETDPAYFCTCGHHAHAHYGEDGEKNCGEPGCPCERWEAQATV